MQYNWKHRIYHRGRLQSNNFDDMLPKRLNVTVDYLMWQPHTSWKTPINGVRLLPYHDSPEFVKFLRTFKPEKKRISHIWAQFKQAIFEQWMPDKIHVIGTSSGYDSRIIAKAIKELRKKHGSGWFGETYFVECAGESEGFKATMKALGYNSNNYVIWEPDFDFDFFMNHHKRYNGICAYPMNQWWDFYVKNWNEEDIQYISGYGGNVSDAMRNRAAFMKPIKNEMSIPVRLRHFFKWNYNYQLSAFRQPKYSMHPFFSWRYITAVSGFDHREIKTSYLLAKTYVKECAHVERMRILGEVTANGHRTVKPKVMKKLYDWYRSTKYGKRSGTQPRPTIEYNKWWLEFCIASFLDEKHNISIR